MQRAIAWCSKHCTVTNKHTRTQTHTHTESMLTVCTHSYSCTQTLFLLLSLSLCHTHTYIQNFTFIHTAYRQQVYGPSDTNTYTQIDSFWHTVTDKGAHTSIGAAAFTWKITVLLTRQHQLSAWERREGAREGGDGVRGVWWGERVHRWKWDKKGVMGKQKRCGEKPAAFCQHKWVWCH